MNLDLLPNKRCMRCGLEFSARNTRHQYSSNEWDARKFCSLRCSSNHGPIASRFWQYAERGDGCWKWLGRRHSAGYGVISVDGQECLAHRISYELAIGTIPFGLEIDHLCRNRMCVRPDHLEAVSHRENVRRGPSETMRLFRSGKCKQGHQRTSDRVGKACLECLSIHNRLVVERRRLVNGTSPRRRIVDFEQVTVCERTHVANVRLDCGHRIDRHRFWRPRPRWAFCQQCGPLRRSV